LSIQLTDHFLDNFSELFDRILFRIAEINWLRVVAVHQRNETLNQITDVLEGPSLITGAVDLQPV